MAMKKQIKRWFRMNNTKTVLSKLIEKLQVLEQEFSVSESNLPKELKAAHLKLNQFDNYNDHQLINFVVDSLYKAYKNDLDRVVNVCQ